MFSVLITLKMLQNGQLGMEMWYPLIMWWFISGVGLIDAPIKLVKREVV